MAKINILHLVNGFSDSSISRIILRLISNMRLETVCWHIGGLSFQGEMKDEFSLLGANIIDFSKNGEYNLQKTIKTIREYIIVNEIRIIHTHTPRTIFTAAFAIGNMPDVKHLATKHLLTSSSDRKWGNLIALIDRLSLYFPDHLIPVSESMNQQILRQPFIKKERVTTIRNAIPQEHFYVPDQRMACRDELGLSPSSIVLGYTGRIQQVKRIDILLDAFSQIVKMHPDTRLVIVGDGKEKTQLEAYATTLGISDKVIWTGFRKDVPQILAAIDIYVQASLNEGLSLSILEAMAAGKPVIATDVGGTSEVIKNGVSGSLIKKGSVTELVTELSKMINNPEFRDQLSQNGLELIRSQFSLETMVKGYQSLYETVLNGKEKDLEQAK